MKRTTTDGGVKAGRKQDVARRAPASPDTTIAVRALHALRVDLRRTLSQVDAAIAEIEGPPPVGAASRNKAPDELHGTTVRPKRPAPLREKGERGRRAPVLPGRRTTPPRGPVMSPDTPGDSEESG